jgi:hypothetical protein
MQTVQSLRGALFDDDSKASISKNCTSSLRAPDIPVIQGLSGDCKTLWLPPTHERQRLPSHLSTWLDCVS